MRPRFFSAENSQLSNSSVINDLRRAFRAVKTDTTLITIRLRPPALEVMIHQRLRGRERPGMPRRHLSARRHYRVSNCGHTGISPVR